MSSLPIVSVIIPVYNAEKYLRECLDSVAGQTLKNIEIICVDDGSEDSSPSILRACAERDGRFRILSQKNRFAGVARNNGLREAKGKYVLFLDSDDFFEETMLEKVVSRAEDCSAQVTLFGAWRYHLDAGKDENMNWMVREELTPLVQPFSAREAAGHLFQLTTPAPWNKLFLRSFVQSLGLQFQPLSNSNDLFFTLSALTEAETIAYTTEKFVHYRVGQSTNLQSNRSKNPLNFYQAILGLKERLIERGLMDTFRESYLAMARDNCRYNLDAISDEALETEQRSRIVEELCENLPAPPERPEISIIVPVYNVEKYLRPCLDSLCAQTLRNIEILCVNDCSTDESFAVLEEYAARDGRIRVIDKKENTGSLLARKSGVMEARGKYIVFVDSDDELPEDACEVMLGEMKRDPADIIQFGIEVDDRSPLIGATEWHERGYRPTEGRKKREAILRSFFIERDNITSMLSKIYTRELCLTVCSHIPELYCYVGEDIFFFFYTAIYANSWRGVPSYKAYRYKYGNGVMNTDTVEPEKFRQNCRMAECVEEAESFLSARRSETICHEALAAMGKRMLTDCLRLLKNRVAEERLPEAARMVIRSWSSCPFYAETLKTVLDVTPERFESRYLNVPVFDRLGTAWEDDGKVPAVSVIVPVYNVQEYLGECLDSLVNQTLREIQIIVVNDGSPDDSLTIALEYAEKDDRVSVISRLNGGLSAARNRGMAYAMGKYLIFLDSDDYFLPETFEKLHAQAEAEGTDIIYFGAESFFEDAETEAAFSKLAAYYYRNSTHGPVRAEKVMETFSDLSQFRAQACLQFFRRDYLEKNRLGFLNGVIHEDELFTPLALSRAETVAVTDENFYQRRVRSGSIMTESIGINHFNGYFTVAFHLLAGAAEFASDEEANRFLMKRAERIFEKAKSVYLQLPDPEKKCVLADTPQEICFFFNELTYVTNLADVREAERLKQSAAYRAGEAVLWLPKTIRSGVRYLKEHGIGFVFRRLLSRLGIGK